MNHFCKIIKWYRELSDFTRGSLVVILLLIAGIILRWDYIIEGIIRGFKYISK